MIEENRVSKYLLYAIGEILLVVIGILIALQINNWNIERQNLIKEQNYLADIKINLLEDKALVESVLNFNTEKIAVIDSIMNLLENTSEDALYMEMLANNRGKLGSFGTFNQQKQTFNNLIATDKINIIQNKELRNLLSFYYNYDFEDSPQSVTRNNTRSFSKYITSQLIGDPTFQDLMNININIKDPDFKEFHNDREAIGLLYIMKPNMIIQSIYVRRAGKQIDTLLIMINKELSK